MSYTWPPGTSPRMHLCFWLTLSGSFYNECDNYLLLLMIFHQYYQTAFTPCMVLTTFLHVNGLNNNSTHTNFKCESFYIHHKGCACTCTSDLTSLMYAGTACYGIHTLLGNLSGIDREVGQ
jgi:hypothetical protein